MICQLGLLREALFLCINNMPIPASSESPELNAVNQILSSIGQAPVTDLNQTNPEVAICYNTLLQVSREVQSEGWTFNKEFNVPVYPLADGTINWPDDVMEMDVSQDPSYYEKANVRTVKREYISSPGADPVSKVYDRQNHTFIFPLDSYKFDFVYLRDFDYLPLPVQNYIIARASAFASSRLVGDAQQYGILQQQEAYCRSMALEYECNQGNYSMFGDPRDGTNYMSYQPYIALRRF